jgi:hypothetical protein
MDFAISVSGWDTEIRKLRQKFQVPQMLGHSRAMPVDGRKAPPKKSARRWSAHLEPNWRATASARFGKALALQDGWAGQKSKAVCPRVASIAHRLLELAMKRLDQPIAPFVIPLAAGGLQLEWHTERVQLEVYFESEGTMSAWACDRDSGFEVEAEGREARDLFLRWAVLLDQVAPLEVRGKASASLQTGRVAPRVQSS